ncbi:MAG: DUF5011 domain-containing protein, partial [Sulfurovum sp.]|nr:DUF5011 domain-containing protein [Sulfurovum sp.]
YTYKAISTLSTDWTLHAIGDVDMDGNTDILWRKGSSNYLWYMKADGTHTSVVLSDMGVDYLVVDGRSSESPTTDTQAPTITLIGENTVHLTVGDTYIDAGATAADDVDGNLTENIQVYSTVDTSTEGNYTVTYDVNDSSGNSASQIIRMVIVSNSIEKEISIPQCNQSNPKVHFINSINDWDMINSIDKTIFCVSPGDYSELGRIELTTKGTAQEPRYIVLNNGNDLHPAKLQTNQLAKYVLELQNTEHWVVDRQAFWETTDPFKRNEIKASSHNIFNRGLFLDTATAYALYHQSVDNTIQKNHIEKTQWSVNNKNFYDTAAINLFCQNDQEYVKNTIIVNNEIINHVDAIQTVRIFDAVQDNATIDFAGTIISNNLMYVTDIMYTDGNGYSNKQGQQSFTENAIDLKGGSADPSNPILITHNMMWGYKKSDSTYSGIDDPGSAIVTHYSVRNVNFTHNYMFNSDYGFTSDGPMAGKSAIEKSTIKHNVFYKIQNIALSIYGTSQEGIFNGAKDLEITENFFSVIQQVPILKVYNVEDVNITHNTFVKPTSIVAWLGGQNKQSSKLTIVDNQIYEKESDNVPSDVFYKEYIIRKFTNQATQKEIFYEN